MTDLLGNVYKRGVDTTSPLYRNGTVWFAFAIAAAIGIFWYGIESLFGAWQTPEYSHGPVIPVLSFYMFLREMKAVPATTHPVTDRWAGASLVVLALLVGVIGNFARVPDIVTYAMILWIGGMILVCFGLRRGWYFWPSVLHLVFMLPLPQFVFWKVTIFLQLVSSRIGVEVIAMLGIPVFLDGNIIDLGDYKLQVAEACSGLRYLFPVMSFSYVFGVLYTGPVWHKLLLLASAAPITVLMNSFRIGVIGVLVDRFGIAQAEGFLHAFEGWIIFVACVVILFGIAWLLQLTRPGRHRLSEAVDIDFSGIGGQIARVATIDPSRAIITVALATAIAAGSWHFLPQHPPVPIARSPFVLFPDRISGWDGTLGWVEPEVETVLGADDYHVAIYASPAEAQPVDLFVAWYSTQTEGDGIHSPQVCLPAGGWEVVEFASTTVTTASGQTVPLVRAVIQKEAARNLVYYWFAGRGRRLTNDYIAKAYTLWDSATTGRSDGGIVRLVTPIGSTETMPLAEARLTRFLDETLQLLPQFVPD